MARISVAAVTFALIFGLSCVTGASAQDAKQDKQKKSTEKAQPKAKTRSATPARDSADAQGAETIKPPTRRIIGGEKTDIKDHPWQVALQFKGEFFCGGSIVAPKWVLTAAHCFQSGAAAGDWRAKSGVTDHTRVGTWAGVDLVVIHEAFKSVADGNDLALIKLKAPAKGKLIALAAPSIKLPLAQPLEVTGWGKTESGAPSPVLLKATVPYVDTAVCNEPASYDGGVEPGMLCAGRREGGVDACAGDSGGPLVWRTSDGPVLVGVVSAGVGCAKRLKYGIYTRVSEYRDWIDRVIAANGN